MDTLEKSLNELEQAIEKNCRLIVELREVISEAQDAIKSCIEAVNMNANKQVVTYLLHNTQDCLSQVNLKSKPRKG